MVVICVMYIYVHAVECHDMHVVNIVIIIACSLAVVLTLLQGASVSLPQGVVSIRCDVHYQLHLVPEQLPEEGLWL